MSAGPPLIHLLSNWSLGNPKPRGAVSVSRAIGYVRASWPVALTDHSWPNSGEGFDRLRQPRYWTLVQP